jgi:hypothetical protein
MAIKERWNRMVRKSVSSSSSGGQTDRASSPSAGGDDDGPLSKPTSRLAKALTWRSDNKTSKKKSASKQQLAQPVHPCEKELTDTNLRHQELLSAFTMNFGRRWASGGRPSYCSGISPGNSRQASVDASYAPHGHGHPGRGISSLANDVPREEAETA